MVVGVVIPVGPGREENLREVLKCLAAQTVRPAVVVVVEDGHNRLDLSGANHPHITLAKHEPGAEQPRNVGVRVVRAHTPEATHVWFLDSDVVVEPDCLEQLVAAHEETGEARIEVAPYDWLGPGQRPEGGSHMPLAWHMMDNDPRWASFHRHPPHEAITNDLSAGLACFSGNLLWPIAEFERLGGFWSELHHGRCEDGELGLRAVAMGVPISFVAGARGWHLHHKVNTATAIARNKRDVPLINKRHPWVQGSDVFLVDRDGKAFDVRCRGCGQMIHTNAWWAHAEECGVLPALPVVR